MKAIDKKKFIVKESADEDTTRYIDYSKPLNFEQLIKAKKISTKNKVATKKAA